MENGAFSSNFLKFWYFDGPIEVGILIYQCFVQLQTGWSLDQGPHTLALILAPACLPPALHFFLNIAKDKLFQIGSGIFSMAAILYPRLQWVKGIQRDLCGQTGLFKNTTEHEITIMLMGPTDALHVILKDIIILQKIIK